MSPDAVVRRPRSRLRRGREIRSVLRTGARFSGARVVVYVKRREDETRVGFASPRGIGGAVRRNRARRLLKEAWLTSASHVRDGLDIMIVGRPEIAAARLVDVSSDLRDTLSKAGALR